MKFFVLTLFPEMINNVLSESIIGRAAAGGFIEFEAVNIRDYTLDKHKKVDDYPYGGGAGMVMQAQPIYDAYMSIAERLGHEPYCIYMTPQGHTFNQTDAKRLASEHDEIVLLCGHYEGIDERVLEEIVDEYISIGDYVLTGGEMPACVVADAVARMVPGVLTNNESGSDESFENDLLEYPQYSRPEVWRDKRVPAILLSGDHAKVDMWRKEQSIERTRQRRPDLYERYIEANPPKPPKPKKK